MRVSALLMISNDGNLHHKSPNESLVEILQWNDYPTRRFTQINYLDFLQVVEVCSAANGDLGRRVGLVEFEIRVNGHVVDGGFAPELDVD